MPLPLPATEPAHRSAGLQRDLPRLLERHTTLSTVLGDVADLERHCRRTRGHRRNEDGGHGLQSSASPAPDQEATRNLDLNNEALPAALIRTTKVCPGQDSLNVPSG